MLDSFDLIMLRNVAIADCSKDSLVDLHDVKIDAEKSVPEKMNNSFIIFKSAQLAVFKLYVIEISFTVSAGASDTLYENFCLQHKNIKFEFQENINYKNCRKQKLTAVLFYWNYFCVSVFFV